jgi:hypothetical protein
MGVARNQAKEVTMKGTVRFIAIGVLTLALTAVWACSSSGGTTTASTAPASTAAPAGTTASAPATGGVQTHTMSTTAATVPSAASATGLTSAIGSNFGLSGDQASGAVGSVLALSQSKLPASDYTKVANAVPGADSYVQKAKDLGVDTSSVTDMNGLNAAYAKLGISPEIGSKVTPMVVNYIGKAGGPTVQSLLTSVVQ